MYKANQSKLLIRAGIAISIALGACLVAAGQDVRYNFMPGADFARYHSYKWVKIESGAHPNQIVDAQIKQSIDAQLTSKGLTKTDSDKADLYVAYQVAVDKERQ